jgi:hypothetical protein
MWRITSLHATFDLEALANNDSLCNFIRDPDALSNADIMSTDDVFQSTATGSTFFFNIQFTRSFVKIYQTDCINLQDLINL